MAEALSIATGNARLRRPRRDAQQATGVASETTTLVVENMVCGGCMRKIETALAAIEGVDSVRANLSAKRVSVVALPAQADANRLISVLDAAGFKAAVLADVAAPVAGRQERDLLRRVAVAGFAAANIMLLSVSVWSGGAGDMGHSVRLLFHWLSAVIALPTVAYAGQPFFRSALTALGAGRLNMDVPISLGVLLATCMSLYQTFQGSDQIYFDAAVTLLFFLLLGRFLDTRMRTRAEGAAANLLGLRAMSATVLGADGSAETMAARDLVPGMHILVGAGERIAADGRVIEGRGAIEEAIITGETIPRDVNTGDEVFAGSINVGSQLVVEAKATDDNTLLAEIGRLMTVAEQGRGRYVRLADRAAAIYAPAVHLLGLLTFLAWLYLGTGWQDALTAGIAVLIVTCPCALALAVPAVQVAATSRLFALGIIIKAADGLERLSEIDTIVFDKTGTLTTGTPRLAEIQGGDDCDLAAASAMAVASRHPFARALVAAAAARGLKVERFGDVTEVAGQGLIAEGPDGEWRLGSSIWCRVPEQSTVDHAALWFARPGQAPVGFTFEEVVRPDAAAVVAQLRDADIKVEILSGDRIDAVEKIAGQLDMACWRGRQTPADKIARIEEQKAKAHNVLMVGDGLNDAPALAAAHASLSPSTAADISQTTADAIFQGENLTAVVETLAVARASRQMALQNFAIALAYNAVFVPLAMAGVITPLLAAVAMSASSIGVTANALRLRARKLRI